MNELAFWLAFDRVPTIGRARFERLEAFFGSLEEAWSAPAGALAAAGLDSRSVEAVLAARGAITPAAEVEKLTRLGIAALTWHDDAYPALLRELYDRPPVLYVKGALTAADAVAVAVVGTRKMTSYGKQATEHFVEGLIASSVTIVSGLAIGVDTLAHTAALRGGRTIAVLPCALDQVYPPRNAQLAHQIEAAGALVSDYPPGTRIGRDNFWRRNRLIAGLSLGTLVIEAGEQSGALLTARVALEENREVFAVPGGIFAPYSRGTNALIREAGAKLVSHVDDILAELQLRVAPQQLAFQELLPADATETRVLQALGPEPQHIDELCRAVDIPIALVSSALAMLELKGIVRQTAGMQYVRSR